MVNADCHGYKSNHPMRVPPNLHIFTLTAVFMVTGMMMFGIVAMAAALFCITDIVSLGSFRNPQGWFLAHLLLRKESHSKQPIGAVHLPLWLIPASSGLFLLWLGWQWFGNGGPKLTEAILLFLIVGWFSASILGYLSKVYPFLWWAYRFRTKEEKKGLFCSPTCCPSDA